MKKNNIIYLVVAALTIIVLFFLAKPFYRTPEPTPANPHGETIPQTNAPVAATVCRVISGSDDGNLLLAGTGDDTSIYHLSTKNLPITYDGKKDTLLNGMLIEVSYNGMIMETYPSQFGSPSGIRVLKDGTDTKCAMYLDVLSKLWNEDEALQYDVTMVGFDLSSTSLTVSEQAGIMWAFAEKHQLFNNNISPIQGTFDELAEQGYINKEELYWENGCLLSITEKSLDGNKITFNAEKWRSGLGAYFYIDCTAKQGRDGVWSDWELGSAAIS